MGSIKWVVEFYKKVNVSTSQIVSEAEIDLSNAERHRHRVKFQGLPVSESGKYYFKVEFKNNNNEWHQVSAIPLKVIFQSPS